MGDPDIRAFLAAALRGETRPWPAAWDDPAAMEAVGRSAIYHGIAGLLIQQSEATHAWPRQLIEHLTQEARGHAMWELRHRQLLTDVLAAFHGRAIPALLMKGTAIAYDLYEIPASRPRADTDLLVSPRDRAKAEAVLGDLGYRPGVLGGVDVAFALQQPWSKALSDVGRHSIDLHWQVMNAPSLGDLLTFEECAARSETLPRLCTDARTMGRVHLLVHTCLHRAMHRNTPYMVRGQTFYDAERLIWSFDIHLLARSLDEGQWADLAEFAGTKAVARVCLEGLQAARDDVGTQVPGAVMRNLERMTPRDRKSAYFVRSRSLSRAWQDVRAVPGLGPKLRYGKARFLPDPRFVRAKYPRMANAPLPFLYARRLLELVASRGKGGER